MSLSPRHQEAANGDEEGVKRRWAGRKLSGWVVALALLVMVMVMVGGTVVFAKVEGYWENPFTESMYQ